MAICSSINYRRYLANMTLVLESLNVLSSNLNEPGSNFIYGFSGGILEGFFNALGGTGAGLLDLVTVAISTKPYVYPVYIWDDFDVKTTYGGVGVKNDSPRAV